MISSAPAICGTRLGLTKVTASIRRAPAASSRAMKSSLSVDVQQRLLVLQAVAGADLDDLDRAGHGGPPAGARRCRAARGSPDGEGRSSCRPNSRCPSPAPTRRRVRAPLTARAARKAASWRRSTTAGRPLGDGLGGLGSASPSSVAVPSSEHQAGLGVARHRRPARGRSPVRAAAGPWPAGRRPAGDSHRGRAGARGRRRARRGRRRPGRRRRPPPGAAPAHQQEPAAQAAPRPAARGQDRQGQVARVAVAHRPGRRPRRPAAAPKQPPATGAASSRTPRPPIGALSAARRQPRQGAVERQGVVDELGGQQLEHQPGRDQPGEGEPHARARRRAPAGDQAGRQHQRRREQQERRQQGVVARAARHGSPGRRPAWGPGRRPPPRPRSRRRWPR